MFVTSNLNKRYVIHSDDFNKVQELQPNSLMKSMIIIFFLFLAVAQNSSASTDDGGFYPLSSFSNQPKFRNIQNSIFKILVPANYYKQTIDVRFGRGRKLKEEILDSDRPTIQKQASIKQIEACEEALVLLGLLGSNNCIVSFQYIRGTGFLLENSRTLVTATHVISGGLKYRHLIRSALEENEYWPVFVFNNSNQLVLDSTKNKLKLLSKKNQNISNLSPDMNDFSKDISYISTPIDIGQPLRLSRSKPQIGDFVATIGFPSCTNCNETNIQRIAHSNFIQINSDSSNRSPYPNSDGVSIQLSKGSVIVADSDFSSISVQDTNEKLYTTTSIDCVGGNSGGPGLNEKGEVFALASTGFVLIKDGITQRYCNFINL